MKPVNSLINEIGFDRSVMVQNMMSYLNELNFRLQYVNVERLVQLQDQLRLKRWVGNHSHMIWY